MIIVTWLFKAILPENKFLTIILSPLLKYSMWSRIHSLELRAQLCICSIHLLSLGGYSEDRFESSPYLCCLYSHLQIIMIFLTFEWQCIWVWVCKCHSPCMDITGQLQELVLSKLSEVGSLVCHCVHQVHWHELPGDYRQVLRRRAFQGLQTLKLRSLGFTAIPLWLSCLDNLLIVLFSQTAVLLCLIWKYYHLNMHAMAVNVVVIVGEG